MKLLEACKSLGLDIDTGTSGLIKLEDIESLTGQKLTGNGSKIRRDTKPWEYFNLENIKLNGKVIGFIFDRYKTRKELIGELDSQIKSSEKRMLHEQEKIDDREKEKLNLSKVGLLSDTMYSKKDILKYL